LLLSRGFSFLGGRGVFGVLCMGCALGVLLVVILWVYDVVLVGWFVGVCVWMRFW